MSGLWIFGGRVGGDGWREEAGEELHRSSEREFVSAVMYVMLCLQQRLDVTSGDTRHTINRTSRYFDATEKAWAYSRVSHVIMPSISCTSVNRTSLQCIMWMGACGPPDRALDSRSEGVEVSGNLCIPHCLGPPSRNGYLVERSKVGSIIACCIGAHLAMGKVKSVEHTLSWSLDSKQLPLPLTQNFFVQW